MDSNKSNFSIRCMHIYTLKVSIQSWYCISGLFLFLFLLEARAVGAKNQHSAYEALFEAAHVIFVLAAVWFRPHISCPRQMWPWPARRTAEIGFLMPPIRNAWKVPASDERRTSCVYLIEGQPRKQVSLRLLRNAIYLGAFLRRFSPKTAKTGILSKLFLE